MATEVPPRSKRTLLRLLVFVGVVVTGLAVVSAVFAGWTTISLTNGSIDTTWGAASYSEPTNDGSINDRDDIKNAWVRYDGANIYFRLETWTGPVLSSNNYRAVGAVDCNHDGDFTDPIVSGPDGDRLIVYAPDNSVTIYDGAFTGVGPVPGDYSDPTRASVTTNIEWAVPLYLLPPGCRGSVSPVNIAWSTGTGAGMPIDQSSTLVELSNPMDYGDTVQTLPPPPATCSAPDTATGLQCNGARHGILPPTPGGSPLRFGNEAVDADPGNLQSSASDADDASGTTPDDEGGIYPDATNSWSDGAGILNFTIVGASSARVGCWIDFSKNGVWTDAGENVVNNAQIGSSTTTRGITIPGGLSWPNSFPARCRIWHVVGAGTPAPVSAPDGPIEFGEVEDHIWAFDAAGNYVAPCAAPAAPAGLTITAPTATTINLNWSAAANATGYEVWTGENLPYFDPSALNCASPAPYQCSSQAGVSYGAADLGSAAVNHSYLVRSVNSCGQVSGLSTREGEFDFDLAPGLP